MVYVRLKDPTRAKSSGSGFFISGTMVVEWHMAENAISTDFDVFETMEDAKNNKLLDRPLAEPMASTGIAPKAPKEVVTTRQKETYTKKELEDMADGMSFGKFRSFANRKFRVTGRSIDGLIRDILGIQSGSKKPEV